MAKVTVTRSLPPLPETERGASTIINTDTPGDRILYCSGNDVIWRTTAPLAEGKAESPAEVFRWKGHAKRTTCAAMSPNSQWVVSGDETGAIRVWGAKGDNVQKNEYKLWDGVIKDVSWSSDSTRLFACGDGKEVRAAALIWDTGSKTGEVGSHSKKINSISFRSQRPFRVITGSEDMSVNFHEGPPFKYKVAHTSHSNFVNCVRYSPDGEWAFSAGSDSKLVLYTGKEGELAKEFEKPEGISGSLWAGAWSPDSARIVTAGGDKKVRVWGREAGKQLAEAKGGNNLHLQDMQVGVSWPTATRIISLCLDGRLLFWDVAPDGALSLVSTADGTQGPLTCVAVDGKTGATVHGGREGGVAVTMPDQPPRRLGLSKTVSHVVAHSEAASTGEAWVCLIDGSLRRVSLDSATVSGDPIETKEFLVGLAWLDAEETHLVAATKKNGFLAVGPKGVEWRKEGALPRCPTAFTCRAGKAAAALDKPDGAVGISGNKYEILLFNVAGTSAEGLTQQCTLEGHTGEVCSLAISPSGEFLASGDGTSKIFIWNLKAETPTVQISEWCFHTARVSCLAWLPDGRKLVTGGLDRYVYVFDVDNPKTKVTFQEAHQGGVSAVAAFSGAGRFATVGLDGFMLQCQAP